MKIYKKYFVPKIEDFLTCIIKKYIKLFLRVLITRKETSVLNDKHHMYSLLPYGVHHRI